MSKSTKKSAKIIRKSLSPMEARIQNLVAAAFVPQGSEFTIDSKGRRVRQFTADKPLDADTVRNFYRGNRMVEEEECLEEIGYAGFRYQVSAGHLVPSKHVSGQYYVSKKAAKNYGLGDRAYLRTGVYADWLA